MDTPEVRRRGSGLTAIVVVIGAVLVWWLFSGNGPQGPPGNDPRLLIPEGEASARPGAAAPADPTAAPDTVRIVGYVLETPDKVLVRWTSGPERCGEVGTPRVLESDVSVIVTLPLTPGACPATPETHTVRVGLESDLGDRALLDGSVTPPVRVTPDRAD